MPHMAVGVGMSCVVGMLCAVYQMRRKVEAVQKVGHGAPNELILGQVFLINSAILFIVTRYSNLKT